MIRGGHTGRGLWVAFQGLHHVGDLVVTLSVISSTMRSIRLPPKRVQCHVRSSDREERRSALIALGVLVVLDSLLPGSNQPQPRCDFMEFKITHHEPKGGEIFFRGRGSRSQIIIMFSAQKLVMAYSIGHSSKTQRVS